MGHLIFVVLHVAALALYPWALILTVPLHVIFAAVSRDRPTVDTHVRCPACRELVRRDATLCMHCKSPLTPQPVTRTEILQRPGTYAALGIVALIVAAVMAAR